MLALGCEGQDKVGTDGGALALIVNEYGTELGWLVAASAPDAADTKFDENIDGAKVVGMRSALHPSWMLSGTI